MRTLTLIAIFVLIFSGCAARQNPAESGVSYEQNAAPAESAEAEVENLGRLDVSPSGLNVSVIGQNMIGLLFFHFESMDSGRPAYFPRRLYADFGNATNSEISGRMAHQLEFLADELATNPEHKIIIIVFDESANTLIAIERAFTVLDFLMEHGVSREQIIMLGDTDAQNPEPGNQIMPHIDTL